MTSTPAGPVLDDRVLRTGYDSRGRFSASRFPEGDGALVLTAERPVAEAVRG